MALLFLSNGLAFGGWLPWLPQVRDRLGLGLDGLGLTLAAGGGGALIGSVIAGALVARFGSRRSALVSAAVLAVTLPLLAVAPSPLLLALVLAVGGLADVVADIGMNAVGVRVEESRGRSILSRLHGLWSVGSLIGAGSAALALLLGLGMAAQLTVLGVAGLAVVAAGARLIPEVPARAAVGRRPNRVALGLVVAGAVVAVVEGTPHDWGAVYLVDVTGAGGPAAGAGIIALTLGLLLGRMAGDGVVDRHGPRRTLVSGIALVAVAMGLLVVAQVPALGIVALALWGLGISVAFPILYKLAGAHRSFREGAGLGAMVFGNRLGFIAAPALIGTGAAAWGLPTAVGVVVGAASLASILTVRTVLTEKADTLPRGGTP